MRTLIILSVGLIAAGIASAQSPGLTQAQAQEKLVAAGFEEIRELELDDGFWEAEARGTDGRRVDVRVHPVSGKVYADGVTPKVDAKTVAEKLAAAGYTNVRDIDFDDGVWTADASNKAGVNVDVAVDPDDGKIISERPDD